MPLPKKKLHERRHHRRLTIDADVFIKREELVFTGKVINISDTGAYVATNGPYSIGDPIELVIHFDHDATRLSITIPGKVARIDGRGIGLSSSHIDANMLQRLELIFDVSKENTKQLIEEFFKTI